MTMYKTLHHSLQADRLYKVKRRRKKTHQLLYVTKTDKRRKNSNIFFSIFIDISTFMIWKGVSTNPQIVSPNLVLYDFVLSAPTAMGTTLILMFHGIFCSRAVS